MTTCTPTAIAAISTDFWKLLRSYEGLAATLPVERTTRAAAQARYAANRLELHLDALGMKLVSFDGERIGAELPLIAVNADEFTQGDILEVETTLEPAIVAEGTVVQMARVIAKRMNDVSGN